MDHKELLEMTKRPLSDGIYMARSKTGAWVTNVKRKCIQHSPDGFAWGYGGSGPADFALNILENVLILEGWKGPRTQCYKKKCFTLAWDFHQQFKWSRIAGLSMNATEQQVIPYDEVVSYLRRVSREFDDFCNSK